MSSLPDLEIYKAAEECRKKKTRELKDVEGLLLTISFQPISSGAMKASEAKGGSPLGIATKNHQCKLFTVLQHKILYHEY